MTKTLLALLVLCLCIASTTAQTHSADDYNTIFKPLKWRSIGPFRGGRSVAGTDFTPMAGTSRGTPMHQNRHAEPGEVSIALEPRLGELFAKAELTALSVEPVLDLAVRLVVAGRVRRREEQTEP